ncbi:MAG: phage integrase SAM-like domain-containing protein [Pirellulales bacterium]|nr:phage integrase SAM-like domain-containing protein [Pirellulales bacterium]
MPAALLPSARKLPAANGIQVAYFLLHAFLPHRRISPNSKYGVNVRHAVRLFERFLKRCAHVSDLNRENLLAFGRRLAQLGYSQRSIRQLPSALSMIAKHAYRLGLLANWKPLDRPRKATSKPARIYPPGTLCNFLQTLFKAKWKLSPGSYKGYLQTFERLNSHLGHHAQPEEITPECLQGYLKSLKQAGYQADTCRFDDMAIRRIMREFHPERFPKRCMKILLPPPEVGTLREYFENTYQPIQLTGCSTRSTEDYRHFFRYLRDFRQGRDIMLSELTDSLAADYFKYLQSRGMNAVTINNHRARLFAIWRYAEERGKVSAPPRVRKFRVAKPAPDAWTQAELESIIRAPLMMSWGKPKSGIVKGKLFYALFLTAYWTGLRRASLAKLTPANVNLRTGWLDVDGTQMKNGIGKRYRLGCDALEAIRAIWNPERKFLFPGIQNTGIFYKQLRRIFKFAGVTPSARKSVSKMHKLRRTAVTLVAIKQGLQAASEFAGHSNIAMTKLYVDQSQLIGNDATEFLPMLTTIDLQADASHCDNPINAAPKQAADFLADAKRLYDLREYTAAAMLSRVALERWLHAYAKTSKTALSNNTGMRRIGHALHKESLIDEVSARLLNRIAKTANNAAHGNERSHKSTLELIEGTELLMNRYPLVATTAAELE